MRFKFRFLLAGLSFILIFAFHCAAENSPAENEDNNRYVLLTVGETGGIPSSTLRRVPALVLDTWQGVIWRCRNLQEETPVWIKNDLAKQGNDSTYRRRYVVKISDAMGNQFKVSAIVLDIEEGRAWTCHDISAEVDKWVLTDLVKDVKQEGYKR